MKCITVADAPVLIPNKEHKNFTESGEVIKAQTEIEGDLKKIQGLRKGEPFIYRFFSTIDNKLIYENKIKPMESTEVKLGADAQKTPTILNIPNAGGTFSRKKVIGLAGGAIAGFAYCKYKKHDSKKTVMYTVVGAIVGYLAGVILENQTAITVQKSK